MHSGRLLMAGALTMGIFAAAAPPAAAEVQEFNFEVVGTWGFLEIWKDFES